MTGVLRHGHREETQREGHVKTEAQVRVTLPQAKGHTQGRLATTDGLTGSWERQGGILPESLGASTALLTT